MDHFRVVAIFGCQGLIQIRVNVHHGLVVGCIRQTHSFSCESLKFWFFWFLLFLVSTLLLQTLLKRLVQFPLVLAFEVKLLSFVSLVVGIYFFSSYEHLVVPAVVLELYFVTEREGLQVALFGAFCNEYGVAAVHDAVEKDT